MHGGFHPKSSMYTKYEHIRKKDSSDELLSEYLRQQKPNSEERLEASGRKTPCNALQIKEVADSRKSYQWLKKAGLKDSTEVLIMIAQERL